MNSKQEKALNTLKGRVDRYSNEHDFLWEKGLSFEIMENEGFIQFMIKPVDAKWYETLFTIIGSVGERGGIDFCTKFASKEEKQLIKLFQIY